MRTGWWIFAAALAMSVVQHADAHPPALPDGVPSAPVAAVPSIEEAMALPEELRAEVRRRVLEPGGTTSQKVDRLADYVFGSDGLALVYDNGVTRTVAETWRDRRANCLSFSMLFIALAREVGLEARMQEVGDILVWYQGQRGVYASNHVNIAVRTDSRWKEVDLATSLVVLSDGPRGVDERRVMAHFYNNRGAEAMVMGDTATAEASLQAALDQDPGFASTWTNYGVLLLRRGDAASAERAYLEALRLDAKHSPTLSNLVSLYRLQGERRLQSRYQRKLDEVRRADPFHHFMLALRCEGDGDYECAISRYQRAISLRGWEHQFHFGLSRAYFLSGKLAAAQREMERAYALAGGDTERGIYLDKLEALRNWHARGATQVQH